MKLTVTRVFHSFTLICLISSKLKMIWKLTRQSTGWKISNEQRFCAKFGYMFTARFKHWQYQVDSSFWNHEESCPAQMMSIVFSPRPGRADSVDSAVCFLVPRCSANLEISNS